jgi:hypothetical protein
VNEFQKRIGVGTVNYALGRTGPTRERRVIADEGPRKGKLAAIQTDHSNGRVDAQVFVDTIRRTTKAGTNES